MGGVTDFVFGDQGKGAAKAQSRENIRRERFIQEQVDKAKSDIKPLFSQSQRGIREGFQGALNVFGQALPQQAQAFQAGNVAAQQALLSGLPQFQAAILGQPVDLSGLQAQQLPVDLGFMRQSIGPSPLEQMQARQSAIQASQSRGLDIAKQMAQQQQQQPQNPFANIARIRTLQRMSPLGGF